MFVGVFARLFKYILPISDCKLQTLNPVSIMKKLLLIICLVASSVVSGQETFVYELDSNQSMGISGQGPGRDAAINPYEKEDCIALIKNLGEGILEARTKDKEGKQRSTKIAPQEQKRIFIAVGTILYFDAIKATKASVTYERLQ